MASDDPTADAVTGPGGTPPGPPAVRADPIFSDEEHPADPAHPTGTVADPDFSGESPVDAREVEPAAAPVTPAFSGEPSAVAEPVESDVPAGAADPFFAEPDAVAEPAFAEPGAVADPSGVDGGVAVPATGAVPDPADASLPPELAEAARSLFGDRLDLAAAYAELLATEGVVRGLIGPRETPRLWDRHLLNCAVVAERIPEGASVIDVGSGAGLPGLVLAIARPDLSVTLVEPLARRVSFLVEAIQRLGLTKSVRVFRGRAEEAAAGSKDRDPLSADIVTARAVAPLDRLATWCLPLLAPGGRLLALKGASAAEEITAHAEAVGRLGGGEPALRQCGIGVIEPAATVVEVVRERVVNQRKPKGPKRSRGGRRRGGRNRDR
ncbi:16S rRNA (guanine527-N7)-methyltransferase [Micromonospora humi]|uniref:Ribosomal RNA small subunit methyltransferase G n=1 Tax=Micromonospora humi TaxID=745366 RepID=A0A1C5IB98_9ACTN|nr:16S rRNA (guanine527-N7)-methyltransferase [Micromonospora humi]